MEIHHGRIDMICQGSSGTSFIKQATEYLDQPIKITGLVLLWFMLTGFGYSADDPDDQGPTMPLSALDVVHIVQEGETLWSIAEAYTSSNDWEKIYEANRNRVSYTNMIFPGQALMIPESMQSIGHEISELTFESEQEPAETDEVPESENQEPEIDELADGPVEQKVYDPVLEIDGLIIDETISKVGRDFYNAFYSEWDSPAEAFNYTVTVAETPMPNYNTRVTIKVNDTSVYQANLQPRYDEIKGAAHQGVGRTQWYLENYETAPISY
ncbi:MAG: CsgE family curli-type amyloid fiber assembly protein [Balneolales bacterium]